MGRWGGVGGDCTRGTNQETPNPCHPAHSMRCLQSNHFLSLWYPGLRTPSGLGLLHFASQPIASHPVSIPWNDRRQCVGGLVRGLGNAVSCTALQIRRVIPLVPQPQAPWTPNSWRTF